VLSIFISRIVDVPFKIYVGNLSWIVTGDLLRELFEPFGKVLSAEIVTDRRNGRPRGFAFVRMESADAGSRAIADLHGKTWHERPLKVAAAKDPLEQGTLTED
jgi:RNA recognition motif-containing protein